MSLLRWRFGRFVLVGLACAAVDTAVVWALDRQAFRYGVAVTAGFFAGFLLNYVLHARYTFSVARLHASQLLRFIAVVVANYLITLAVVALLHDLAGMDVVIAKVVSLPIVAVNGYWLSKAWVFGKDSLGAGGAA